MPDDARNIALLILNQVEKKRLTLDRILEDVAGENCGLSRRDRALTNAIVYGVLRWRIRLDWIIEYFSKTPLKKIDSIVLNILRIGLFQIIYLNKIPVSAAVNTSVEMAKSNAPPWVAGYVNGVLRNSARSFKQVPYPDTFTDPELSISISKSFPIWIIKRWLKRFGLDETGALCDCINKIPSITVRANTLKISSDKLLQNIEKEVGTVTLTNYSKTGLSFTNPSKPIHKIKAFKDGLFQVQDEAAQLVVLLLDLSPDHTVLDACAGLGGKTGHIAQIMNNSGKVIALDNDKVKLQKLESEMDRLGIVNVRTYKHDLNKPVAKYSFAQFDRILLDAPCSGLGVLRRNPDTKWSRHEKDLNLLKKRQTNFLNNLAQLVKPEGIMVYTVCSTEREENEEVIELFLQNHPEFALDKNPKEKIFKEDSIFGNKGYLKTYPHIHNMDSFFAARLKRMG
jgi:16S rRNA (cytosine967-C5)-methyltransferase